MKLKSLLLGSAAVLALSTGAQAADPIAEFVSLGVCDAYGITGITIESDDTCLSISGSVDYTFETGNYGAGFGAPTEFFTDSLVEWQLLFEATTQTDAGAAVAVLRLNDGTENANGDINPEIERAYVSFGDTTVITAGRIGSVFDTVIVDRSYGALNYDEIDNGYLDNDVATGGHGIQIESLIADGFSVIAALEQLNVDGPVGDANGTAGLAVAYDNGGISGEVGVLLGDIFDSADDVNYYARVMAEFDAFSLRGGILADDTGDWIASIGAGATFDMFSLDVDAIFTENEDFNIGAEGSFDATDTISVYVGAAYTDGLGIMAASYYDDAILDGGVEAFAVYGGVDVAVTETISANAEVGYVDYSGGDLVYGAGGVTYAPGGNFETGLDLYADTDDVYAVTFTASKEF